MDRKLDAPSRRRRVGRPRGIETVLAAVVVLGAATTVVGLAPLAASAAGPSITVTPSTGLAKGQSVTVTGTGFTAKSIGNILECNNDPNIPTVHLGSPVNADLSIGCTGPSYAKLVTVGSDGTVNATWTIVSGTIGPPCGATGDVITTCPSTDSAGKPPAADAANYPCPPTPAQEAAGVTCVLTYGDAANDGASQPIIFTGETAPTTTAGSSPTTTAGAAPTTQPQSTATTAGSSGSGGSGASTGSSGSSGSAGSSGSGATPQTSASSGLASTGPSAAVEWTALTGSVLVLFGVGGLVLLQQSRRRYALLRRR